MATVINNPNSGEDSSATMVVAIIAIVVIIILFIVYAVPAIQNNNVPQNTAVPQNGDTNINVTIPSSLPGTGGNNTGTQSPTY